MRSTLFEWKRIEKIFEETLKLVQKGRDLFDRQINILAEKNIGPLIGTLQRMKDIFDDSEGGKMYICLSVSLSFSLSVSLSFRLSLSFNLFVFLSF
jgi:hypothetical protein